MACIYRYKFYRIYLRNKILSASSIPQNTGIAALINASNDKTPVAETTTSLFGEDGFTFGDIIDIVNPLQHIPIINSIYRKISGDTIAPAMEIAGGALFGGPIGAFTSMLTTAFRPQDKIDSADPNSPYNKDPGTVNSTAIANNTSSEFPKMIGINDYALTTQSPVIKAESNNPSLAKTTGWGLSSSNLNKEVGVDKIGNNHASVNTLKNKHTYQPADGIVNLAYKNTEKYSNAITSREPAEKTIDILIGSNSGAG
jgi:hypothetical protein